MIEQAILNIDAWMADSSTNYGIFFVACALAIALGFGVSWIVSRKIGTSDERTDVLKLRIGYLTLGVGWVSTLIFVSSLVQVDTEHPGQLVLIPLAFTALCSAAISYVLLRKHS